MAGGGPLTIAFARNVRLGDKNCPLAPRIDNLETVLDLETLLPTLRTLVNPSKTCKARSKPVENLYTFIY